MLSNLQFNRTLVKKTVRMEPSDKTVSSRQIQEEWEIIQQAKENPTAFKPLYNRYYEMIFRYIFRRTADEGLAADICSKVFLKSLQQLPTYQFKGVPFSAWLYRIASNEVAQHFRNVKKNRVVSIDDHNLSDMVEEMQERNHENYRNALIYALDELKEDDVQLIELRFFEQRPFKEIANILEITESNAKVRTYRILERLKKIIIKKSKQGQAR